MFQPLIRYFLASLLLLPGLCVFGQATESTNALVQPFDTYRRQALQEKLFVHTDQSFYLIGENLWFKLYYVDGSFHKPLDVSKVAYLELLDAEQKSVLQTKVSLTTNGGNGSLFLPASLQSGTYRLRAYTNWMKNFSADFFFEKNLTIVNPFKPLGLPLLNEVAEYDIQFFPEGGNLVQGLASKVAFKVADASGQGKAVRGWVLNGQNDTLSRFTSHKFGIGSFMVTPTQGTTFRVLIRDEKGRTFTRPLPAIQPQGYTMQLTDAGADQLKITVSTNVDSPSTVYLFAHTRQAIKAAEMRSIQRETTFLLDRKALGEGISHLTIFNANRQPVCERLYFKRPTQQLTLSLKPDQNQYVSRAKVSIDASVLAPTMKSSQAALSMAVYRIDSLAPASSGSILSYLWMTSDLQGTIESPEYYLQSETAEIAQATDNLMLTHGWRRFRWNDVLSTSSQQAAQQPLLRFIPEVNGPIIQGTVTDPASGKPMPNIQTYLSTPGKPVRLFVSHSDSAGRIKFEMQDFYGPKTVIVQTNPADSLAKLTITSPFVDAPPAPKLPALTITESESDQLLSRSVAMQVQSTYWGDRALQYTYPTVDSAAFYGRPSESYLLDAYTRFPRMEEVLREYVLGVMPRKRQDHFRLNVLNGPYRTIFENAPLVMMDGVPVFDMDKIIEFSPLKIKQLDVITNFYYMSPTLFNGIISFMTYKGDLAGFPLDTRLVKLEYDGLQLERQFYSPRYDSAKLLASRLPDARTLLYWNPNLQTNAQGKGHIEFYTSDQPGTYLVEVNGLTKDGVAGSQQVRFEVKNRPE
ncbi:hypothetical protein GO755_02435 [Spirosoma sp. HMF4905]|uniref:Macroglobulin domain-containing protein n=1 Tax=Spirosoma arboris TaxID=2682092 RepID=A0A7K1S552_9BACT|nr:hypothetical protein [Spirosoma arboris]